MGLRHLALEGVAPVVGVGVAGRGVDALPGAGDAEATVVGVPVEEPDVFVVDIGLRDAGMGGLVGVWLWAGEKGVGTYGASQNRCVLNSPLTST